MNKTYKIVLAVCTSMIMTACGSSSSSGNEPQLETQDGLFVSQFCQQNPQNQNCQQDAFCQANPTVQACQPSTQCINPQAAGCSGKLTNAVQQGYSPDYFYNSASNTHCCPAGGVPTDVDGAFVCATTVGQKQSTTGGVFRTKFVKKNGHVKTKMEAEVYAADHNESVTNYTNVAGNHCYPQVQIAPYSAPTTSYNNQPGYNPTGYQGNTGY